MIIKVAVVLDFRLYSLGQKQQWIEKVRLPRVQLIKKLLPYSFNVSFVLFDVFGVEGIQSTQLGGANS